MSFSQNVKEELQKVTGNSRHCQLAELAALFQFCAKIEQNPRFFIKIQTENKIVARKCFTLLQKAFNIYTSVTVRRNANYSKYMTYIIEISDEEEVIHILQTMKWYERGSLTEYELSMTASPLLFKSGCCKRSFLRGAYLAVGSMSNPGKSYHLEYVCTNHAQAEGLAGVLKSFELDAKIILRKKYYIVYLKEGESIVDFLNIVEAHVALMDLENTRILKEMRNSINRRVNCEAANITKTVNAATKQIEDIRYIKDYQGLDKLPGNLREMASVRLENPDASLRELGELLDPPVGKSGVNHRLRKLSEIADRLKVHQT